MIIDPTKITKTDRTQAELEVFFIFSVCVAGKNAHNTSNAITKLLSQMSSQTPFEYIRFLDDNGVLIDRLKEAGIGQYNRIATCLRYAINNNIDLETATVEDLETIPGIGPKTSRFFIIHSRKTYPPMAALDVHILKFLKLSGYDAPKSTPTGPKYKELEQAFIDEASKRNMKIEDFDLHIWKLGNQGVLEQAMRENRV